MTIMGLRLYLLDKWTPGYLLQRELDRISRTTISALQKTLDIYAPQFPFESPGTMQSVRSLVKKRAAMARQHAVLVEALEKILGTNQAIEVGRNAMFEAGRKLGKEARDQLGVGESLKDLVRAAQIMYRILGIRFVVEWTSPTSAKLVVNRCALSKDYSNLTCLILSAVDEGVVEGLNGKIQMSFQDRIANGCSECTATVSAKPRED